MHFRIATTKDTDALAEVFFTAVREGPSPYTDAQRQAWMPKRPQSASFAERLGKQFVVLAEHGSDPIGFMTVAPDGYIDLVFILHKFRGKGVFRTLFHRVEEHARDRQMNRLWTHASLLAQPTFQAMGFSVIQHETVVRDGQYLQRAEMEKALT